MDGADVLIDLHGDGGPVGGGTEVRHRFDAEPVDPKVEFAPSGLVREFCRDTAVGTDEPNAAGLREPGEFRGAGAGAERG